MPKVMRSKHANRLSSTSTKPSTSIINRQFSTPETHCETLKDIKEFENLSANTILKEFNNPKPTKDRTVLPLDEKRQKRIQEIRQVPKPYSKSHQKRIKKKSKEIGKIGNLESVKTALNELNTYIEPTICSSTKPSNQNKSSSTKPKSKKSPNLNQRANLLHEESSRLPKILSHPEFKLDGFSALRTHIKNTFNS
ncbi:uncharacterized protein MELLADRAFT_109316 [Melampsora larici-populina 98AG31]|uniref:Ribosome biogenesis protein SLX9 n=1 Tax=Melampsora larici-populina (strain 98AG31 / pathotype 3-4-7) TaxID=747676 RepID=F4RW27_MELLP|nr:uncharacterized protein MELLADRAFT_109316 [Melampsora larici-populina 98AG31]EGG03482.1 hypothetical protein MELLADRAFT_109316 [Melampsora larici-populina 98AG31]